MPIRIRGSTDSRVGRVSAVLGGLSPSFEGTHVAPPNVAGRVIGSFGALSASMRGQFAVPSNRNGRIASTLGALSASARGAFVPASQFPLSVHSGGRYLIDSFGAPFFLQGDTPWMLPNQLTNAETDQYLTDTAAKGFNTIMVEAPGIWYTSQSPSYLNVDGVAPFSTMTDWGSSLTAYWNRVDYLVNQSKALGIAVIINPAYRGFGGIGDGWLNQYMSESDADLQLYGQRLAQRYTQGNVIWCLGGDTSGTTAEKNKQWNIVTGIRSVRTTDIITAHNGPGTSSFQGWNGYAGLNLNYAYDQAGTTNEPYVNLLTEYARSPAMPVFLGEGRYENEGSAPQSLLRRQTYQALTSGACGQLFGNNPIWHFESPQTLYSYTGNWESHLNSTGRQQQAIFAALVDSIAWWKLAPSTGTGLVTTALGSGATRICPALASDGTLALVWKPSSGASTVNMAAMSGVASVRARFFDPTTGGYTLVSGAPFSPSGTQSITWPGERLLILDSATNTTAEALLSLSSPSVTEGGTLQFVLSRAADGQAAIQYFARTTNAGTATAGVDFTAHTSTGTISSGGSVTLNVTTNNDAIAQGNRTVVMEVRGTWN